MHLVSLCSLSIRTFLSTSCFIGVVVDESMMSFGGVYSPPLRVMFFFVGLIPFLGLIRPLHRLLYQPDCQTVVLLMGLTRSDVQMRLCVLMRTGAAFYRHMARQRYQVDEGRFSRYYPYNLPDDPSEPTLPSAYILKRFALSSTVFFHLLTGDDFRLVREASKLALNEFVFQSSCRSIHLR